MRPKPGQTIKIIQAEDGAFGANGCIGNVVSIGPYFSGALHGTGWGRNTIFVDIPNHKEPEYSGIWSIGENPEYEIIEKEWDNKENK